MLEKEENVDLPFWWLIRKAEGANGVLGGTLR